MTGYFQSVQLFSVLVIASAVVACDKRESPTTPTGTQPAIASITPGALQPNEAPQVVTFSGSGFDTGLQLIIEAPNGSTTTLQGPSLESLQPTSFQATLVLNQTGTYKFVARNASGTSSATFTTIVQSPGSVLPVVYSLTPGAVQRSTVQGTLVAVQGANFAPNSAVILTDPNGVTMILTAGSLSVQTDTSVQFTFTFSVRGTYTVVISNPSGDASNPVFVAVN